MAHRYTLEEVLAMPVRKRVWLRIFSQFGETSVRVQKWWGYWKGTYRTIKFRAKDGPIFYAEDNYYDEDFGYGRTWEVWDNKPDDIHSD